VDEETRKGAPGETDETSRVEMEAVRKENIKHA